MPQPIDLAESLSTLTEPWSPLTVALMNDYDVRVVRTHGEFTWHSHSATDELFLVIAGDFAIEFRDSFCRLAPGELIVVPRGTEHRPVANGECQILMLDREGEPNTGAAPSAYPRAKLETI